MAASLSDDDILREFLRRDSIPRVDLAHILFPAQKKAFKDEAQFQSWLCTRRAGKTTDLAVVLIEAAQKYPGCQVPYFGLTRDSVRNTFWPILQELNTNYGLKGNPLESKLELVLPNGSRIRAIGADQKNFIQRVKGAKYPVAAVDEAQAFRPHIRELIDEALIPAIGDYNGKIIMAGTPGPIPHGMFYEATTQPKKHGWSLHSWSLFDNPHFPDARGFVDAVKTKRGWTDDNPTLLREFYGKWVQDFDSLVYKFQLGRNEYRDLPVGGYDWTRILGVDFGFNDKTAFSVLTYCRESPVVYCEYAYGESGLSVTAIASIIKDLRQKYAPVKIVGDCGALGKTIAEELRKRHGIPLHPAEKTQKLANIALLNDAMRASFFKVHESQEDVKHQYMTLTHHPDGTGREDPVLPNDLADCILYAWREAKAYAAQPREVPVKKTEAQVFKEEEDKYLRNSETSHSNEQGREWWER